MKQAAMRALTGARILSSKVRAVVPEYDWYYIGVSIGAVVAILLSGFARVLP
jgi:hypothetical protein